MNHESRFKLPVTYCNITSSFSGIGHILLDINSVIITTLKNYKLNLKTCPNQIIFLHFQYLVQNLKKYQLKDILFFYEYTGDYHFDLAISILNDGSFIPFSEVMESLENKRISLALSCTEREDLLDFLSNSGLYIGFVDYLIFEVPFAFTMISKPNSEIKELEPYKISNEYSVENETNKTCFEEDEMKNFNSKFFDFDSEFSYSSLIDEFLVKDILFHNLNENNEKIFFDGGNLIDREYRDSSSDRTLFNLTIDKPWAGKDLDLIMSSALEKTSQRHLANIRRSAMSLYDGKFHYSTISKEVVETPKKMSSKMKAIVEENANRIKKEKEKIDNQWLKNFFLNYSKLTNLKARKSYLETIKISSDYINRKLLLLRIELYSEIWNLETKSDLPDEKILVPLYLSCLSYIDQFVTSDSYDKDELEFVMTKLIESNFEATVREILEKLKIDLKLPFKTNSTSAPNDIDIYFQLKYAGDHLKRTLGTRKDRRVPFDPDKWQVDLLDAVDAGKSAIVAAPTSSGKTFICFYAIEKILKTNDTDVVVFCLPTKALVNQVSADIYARFNPKNVKTSLQGTLMPDISNDPFNCQVLITLPSMLESLLNSRDCSQIKYIIIDEVHKINDSALGLKLERIIHLAHCPLLLLSATLGNLQGFYNWFKNIENSKGRECELVYHGERYCELKSFVYTEKLCDDKEEDDVERNEPTSKDENEICKLETLIKKSVFVPLNNMFAYSFSHLANFGFSNDLHFLPEELLNIYYYIYMILDQGQKKLIKNLAPKRFFKSNIICKADVKEYQHHLLNTFESWVQQGILNEDQVRHIHTLLTKEAHDAFNFPTTEDYIVENILKLLNTLKDSNMLPVIVFHTDRDFVTRLAKLVYHELEDRDFAKKKDKAMEKIKKEMKRTRDAEKTKDSWIEESIAAEQFVEPETRDIKFTFLDPVTKLTDYEVKEEFSDIRAGVVEKDILDMAYRGIGIHHSAMNRKYRAAVEILFRKKHVRVLFATETLALGINMPCRTVVFAGDSLELDPMNYKQMSGRAGRRGYDTLGNIVFFGIPKPRVQNLMVSMLPEIQGAYTYSNTSLVSFNVENSLLKHPLICANTEYSNLNKNIEHLSLNKTQITPNATLDIFDTLDGRQSLVTYQRQIYPFIYPSNYTWDLFISNRDLDPSIFLFAILFENNKVIWTPDEFMNLVSHLFEVRPAHDHFPYKLPSLPQSIQIAIDQINEVYIDDVSKFYPNSIKKLQKLTAKPLFNLKSFIYTLQQSKNSYIYDFFQHGSPVRIRKYNEIIEGELWQSLNSIDTFFKSLILLIETNYTAQDERLKKLKLIYDTFHQKFTSIFA